MPPCAFVARLQTALDPVMGHTPDEIAIFLEGLKGMGFEKAVRRAEAMVGNDKSEVGNKNVDSTSTLDGDSSTQPETGLPAGKSTIVPPVSTIPEPGPRLTLYYLRARSHLSFTANPHPTPKSRRIRTEWR